MKFFHAVRQSFNGCSRGSRLSWLIFLVVGLTGPSISAQEADEDVVIFRNGDRLTGEVKRLDRGRLFFDTDATGEIGVEWDEVVHLTSNQRLEIEAESGAIFLGNLLSSEESSQLHIQTMINAIDIPMTEVVIITPIEEHATGAVRH